MKPVRGALPPQILQQISTLSRIEEILRECLPAACHPHFHASRLEEGTLHLVTDSAAWRARLHFHSAGIIRHFKRLGKFPVERVRVRVGRLSEIRRPERVRQAPSPIPATTARALNLLAEETDEPGLRRALKRLATRGESGGSATD